MQSVSFVDAVDKDHDGHIDRVKLNECIDMQRFLFRKAFQIAVHNFATQRQQPFRAQQIDALWVLHHQLDNRVQIGALSGTCQDALTGPRDLHSDVAIWMRQKRTRTRGEMDFISAS